MYKAVIKSKCPKFGPKCKTVDLIGTTAREWP